jgi:hypothetical protein
LEDHIFAWLNIRVSIILLLPSDIFTMLMARPQCGTPLVFFLAKKLQILTYTIDEEHSIQGFLFLKKF